MSDPDSAQRILDGTAWADFCDALKRAGDVVLRPGSPMDAFDRAEGFRYLSRLSRVALESYIEFADPLFPVLRRPAHETVKIGADNPDNYYQSAAISGEHEYRISGRRNTVHYLGLGTYAGSYGSKARRGQTGYLDAREMRIEPDGSFEILLSCNEQPGRIWLRMEPDTSSLIVRQTFQDRANERIADLHRAARRRTPAPVTPAPHRPRAASGGRLRRGHGVDLRGVGGGFAQTRNRLPLFDPAIACAATAIPASSTSRLFRLARRGAADRGHAARLRLLELPAQQPLDGVARLPLPHDRAEPLRRAGAARRLGATRRRAARPGRSELARHGGTPPRHDVPALGRREGALGSTAARREARGRRGSRLGSDARRRAKSIRWGEPS
jgi:hypothetical protein